MTSTARRILWPSNNDILVRVAFLYVGQGASAVIFIKDGEASYKTMLVDINLDSRAGGIDVPAMMHALLDGAPLDIFCNTHPHDDHLCGLKKLSETVSIHDVWHTGHDPGEKGHGSYVEMLEIIKEVKKAGGKEVELAGSRAAYSIGQAQYYILSPAPHVKKEIGADPSDVRYRRIHEHSAVLKFGDGNTWIMLAGDADLVAFEKHITGYHGAEGRLKANVLGAAHHGSRTFFKEDSEDVPYLDGLKAIAPDMVVVSAPKPEESRFDHPDSDAIDLYENQVGKGNVHVLGEHRRTYYFDIQIDGKLNGYHDEAQLSKEYPYTAKSNELEVLDKNKFALGAISHVERPKWPEELKNFVKITASTRLSQSSTQVLSNLKSDSDKIPSGRWIKFKTTTNATGQIEYYWQVVNTGGHATRANSLRGRIFPGKSTHSEESLYTGKHWVECFIVKNGVCIARSKPFYVNIFNPNHS